MLLMLAEERTGSQPCYCGQAPFNGWPSYRPQKILRVHEPELVYPHPFSILIQLFTSLLQILVYSHLVSWQTCLKLEIRIV